MVSQCKGNTIRVFPQAFCPKLGGFYNTYPGSLGSSALAYSGTLTLGAGVTLYEGTSTIACSTVLDGNTGSSRVYNGEKKQNLFAAMIVVPVTSVTLDQTTASMAWGGKTLTLTATVLPADATVKNVTWTTSDANVATVDANGVVTSNKFGTATITAHANDGSGVTGTCTVTVTSALSTDALGAYLITNEDDWNSFASEVNSGYTYSGKTVNWRSTSATSPHV